jgi:hypothetical protein
MKTKFTIDWHIGWANAPTLRAITNEPVKFPHDEPDWILHPNGFVTSTKGDFTKYFAFGKEGIVKDNNKFLGFGGRVLTFTLKDGRKITSNNVWSGRAECIPPEGTFAEVLLNDESGIAMDLERFKTIVGDLGFFIVNGDISSESFKVAKPKFDPDEPPVEPIESKEN